MRPGPGLVVMALAFISGARRGSAIKGGSDWSSDKDSQEESLPKINPWLSACDLAQPSPDILQGQCSGGTLPMTRVDEGPGPPGCPISCNILFEKKNKKSKIDDNNTMVSQINDKPCLSYLGDADGTSPATICKKTSQEIAVQLQNLRLKHCCERNILSALSIDTFNATINGGAACEANLKQIEDTDTLAARITCEFTEVLVRYDCGQPYSLIHNCEDCKEAYKKWVCSTIIPYFTTRDEMSNGSTNAKNDQISQNGSIGKDSSITIGRENVSNLSVRTKRSIRRHERRIRIRPCLSVCQTVEQKCPYMLPGDRAPGYPTQYAGEPTFLCLDPNIPETGQQRHKSNNGLVDCCYEYCNNGLCTTCDPLYFTSTEDISYSNKPDNKTLVTCPIIPQEKPASTNKQCNISELETQSSSSSLPSKNIFQIKYFANSRKNNILWTMVLCLIQYAAWTKFLLQFTGS